MDVQAEKLAGLVVAVAAATLIIICVRGQAPSQHESFLDLETTGGTISSGANQSPLIEVLPYGGEPGSDDGSEVVFPEGRSVSVEFRPYVAADVEDASVEILDNGVDPGFYELLKPLADAGNGSAALRLAQALVDCLGIPDSSEKLSAAIRKLHDTRTVPMTGQAVRQFGPDGTVYIADDANPFEYEEMLNAQFSRCEGVSGAMKAEADHWLELAAELGSIGGMLGLASEIESSDPTRARMIYQDLWEKGYVSAAGSLASLLETGGEGLEPDPVAAYAYGYLYLELFRLSRDGTGKAGSDVLQRLLEKGLAVRERRRELLMPNELQQASDQARSILESNRGCCYHLFSNRGRQTTADGKPNAGGGGQ